MSGRGTPLDVQRTRETQEARTTPEPESSADDVTRNIGSYQVVRAVPELSALRMPTKKATAPKRTVSDRSPIESTESTGAGSSSLRPEASDAPQEPKLKKQRKPYTFQSAETKRRKQEQGKVAFERGTGIYGMTPEELREAQLEGLEKKYTPSEADVNKAATRAAGGNKYDWMNPKPKEQGSSGS
jgi:hypothetical protein